MKRFKLLLTITAVCMLTACSQYREASVSEDGTLRMITTDNSEEVELKSHLERIVIMSANHVGNALLLDAEVAGVTDSIKGSVVEDELTDETILSSTDVDGIRSINPDLIISFHLNPDYIAYTDIATTIQMSPSSKFLTPFQERNYLNQLFNLGVIVNEEDKAQQLANDFLEDKVVYERQVDESIRGSSALVISEVNDGFVVHIPHTGYGTETVYDVLNFSIDNSVESFARKMNFAPVSLDDISQLNYDLVFINAQSELDSSELSQSLGVDEENIFINDYDKFKLNDLISVQAQSEQLIQLLER